MAAAMRCPFRKALGSASQNAVLPGMTAMAKHCPHMQAAGPAAAHPALAADGKPLAAGLVRVPDHAVVDTPADEGEPSVGPRRRPRPARSAAAGKRSVAIASVSGPKVATRNGRRDARLTPPWLRRACTGWPHQSVALPLEREAPCSEGLSCS